MSRIITHTLALTPGTRLGVYDITAQIGEGGMGQVWRARDSKLNRDVALKVLPDSFANDPDRLARFTREAQTLAALNHPHIAAIYGLEESGGLRALVMELVEGDDLSQRIARGAIPLDEALPIARQIAEALEAAHEQGIIHRDLKPANIKVRADGTVKVLDFGLAKALVPAHASSATAENVPTITTPAMTQAGMILGTAAYMAPEQARGKPVDRRADIWAFGCVVYEMLAGHRAFKGDELSDVLAAVLRQELDWSVLPAATPSRLRRLLARCLERDARMRLRDIGEARVEIDEAIAGVGDETAAPLTTPSATASASRGRLPWMVALAAVAAVAIALALPAVRHLREAPPVVLPETRLDIATPASDQPGSFALSPDGRQIVFVASGDGPSRLWRRSLATTTAQPIAGGQLKRLDLGGGAPQSVAAAGNARGGTWNADGVILFAPYPAGPLLRVPASGGPPVAVTTLARQSSHRFPSFLPDGRHFLFYATGTPDTAGIYLGTLDAPDPHRLTAADAPGVFLPSVGRMGPGSAEARTASEGGTRRAEASSEGGWLLWVRAGTLVAQHLDLARAALTGDPVTLADAVGVDPTNNAGAVSVSASGLVAYRTARASRRQLTWWTGRGRRSARWAHRMRMV